MSDDEEADYEFQYSDEEQEAAAPQADDAAVRIENVYYNTKGLNDADAEKTAGFIEVLSIAAANGSSFAEWAFKATKQLVKLASRTNRLDDMITQYKAMLGLIRENAVTRNRAEKAINGILDLVGSDTAAVASSSSSSSDGSSTRVLRDFYDCTISALQEGGNERLSLKTKMKLARFHLARRDWVALQPLLAELQGGHATSPSAVSSSSSSSATEPSAADKTTATSALEVLTLLLQMYTEQQNMAMLVATHRQAVVIARSAVPHPYTTGVLHECGAKIALRERAFEVSRTEFTAAFKAFLEAGNTAKTISCLKCLLLSNMLSDSRINPFDSQDTKAYERDPAIAVMADLTKAYLAGDIAAFEPILKKLEADIDADSFMQPYITDLLRGIRLQVLLTSIVPYSHVLLSWLGKELGVSPADAEGLAVSLILDGKLGATIDQVAGTLCILPLAKSRHGGSSDTTAAPSDARFSEISRLTARLGRLLSSISAL